MADEKIFNAEFYHKLNTFRMSMKMRLAAGMNGGRKSNAKGNSVEFSDFREYILVTISEELTGMLTADLTGFL